jgi:hypothetical protein
MLLPNQLNLQYAYEIELKSFCNNNYYYDDDDDDDDYCYCCCCHMPDLSYGVVTYLHDSLVQKLDQLW